MTELEDRLAALSPERRQLLESARTERRAPWTHIPRVEPRAAEGLPLSAAQERMWLLDQLDPGTPAYVYATALRLRGVLAVHAIEQAIDAMVHRHEILRTVIRAGDDGPRQLVDPELAARVPLVDFRNLDATERTVAAQALATEAGRRPFDLAKGPLLRTMLVRLGDEEHVLVVALHHVAMDGWSIGILTRELATLYDDFGVGRPSGLPDLEVQYGDFSAWQRDRLDGDELETLLAYWREELRDAPVTELLADRRRPESQRFRGATLSTTFPAPLVRRLRELQGVEGGSLYMLVLAGFFALLRRATGEDDLVIGTLAANRPHADVEPLVGYFVNVLVLRARLNADQTFRELWRQVRRTALGAYAHQELPFEILLEDQRPARDLARTPLVQMLCVMQQTDEVPSIRGLEVEPLDVELGIAQYALVLELRERGEELDVVFQYNTDLYTDATIRVLHGGLRSVIEAVAADPDRLCAELPPLPRAAAAPQVAAGDEPAPYPADRCIHELFEERARRTPDAVAVVAGDAALSFGQLNARANQLARLLRSRGVVVEKRVGICCERSADLIVAQLAVLKAGGAYVPLDPDDPTARLARTLRAADAHCVVTKARFRSKLAAGSSLLCLDEEAGRLAQLARSNLGVPMAPDGLAYVLPTSGSTGEPKSVLGIHRGVVNRLAAFAARWPWQAGDRCCAKTRPVFVDAVCEVFAPLIGGVPLAVARPGLEQEPSSLRAFLAEQQVTRLVTVPSLLAALLEAGAATAELPALRLCVSSGEELAPELARRFHANFSGARLLNVYGASEASADSTVHEVPPDDAERARVPIGRPLANVQVLVADRLVNVVPEGAVAEIFLGGAGLARGYLGRPDLTAERFLPNPWGAPGARAYRTGDRGRQASDGAIEFLGRVDEQVSLRGYRLELGEIEVALCMHAGVRAAAAALREDDSLGAYLAAYVVCDRAAMAPTTDALRAHLARTLPEHALPRTFTVLESLPRTQSGKLDRRALPMPSRPLAGRPGRPPQTPAERLVAAAFADALGVTDVRGEDDFFLLGGHSLLAARLVQSLREATGVALKLKDLFRASTVAQLAERMEEVEGRAPPPMPTVVSDAARWFEPFPLSDVQQAYWIGRNPELELGGVATHAYAEIDVTDLDVERLAAAVRRLVDRHHMLRAVVLADGTQRVLARVPPYQVDVVDLRGLAEDEVAARLDALRFEMSHQVLPADRWPLFDLRVSACDGGSFRIHLSVDALIADVWSYQILMSELSRLYANPRATLKPLELSFRDCVVAERDVHETEEYERALEYWRSRLDDLPPGPELPLARSPASIAKPRFHRVAAELDASTFAELRRRAVETGLTPSGVLLAAFAEVLTAWSRRSRYTLTLTLFNRLLRHSQIDAIVGDFTSLTLLEVDHREGASFRERARRLQERLWDDLDHRSVSGVTVAREWVRTRGGGPRVATPVVFTSTLDLDGSRPSPAPALGVRSFAITQTPQVLLDHQVGEVDGVLAFNWDAVDGVFPEGVLDDMFGSYCRLLRRLACEPALWDAPALELLPERQRARRRAVNATGATLAEVRLETLVARRAALDPGATAVVAPGRTLTYEEVVCRANRVGRRLTELGARPNKLVGVVMEKGWEQVVAVLGVLSAGAAYLPIDPDLPAKRLEYLLHHGEVDLVLTQSWLELCVPWPTEIQRLPVDRAEPWAGASPETLPPAQRLDDLAYVIFTSGSTGDPKGVMVDHRGATNTVLDINRRFRVGPGDRVLGLSALGFDLSVYDVFGTLGAGGTIVLPDRARLRDPRHWADLVAGTGVTIWNSVPTLMKLLVEVLENDRARALRSLRLVLLSGDWIPVDLPERVRALADAVEIVGLGGATEASIWSVLFRIERVDPTWRSIPYGRPMTSQTLRVLDDKLEPRPDRVTGDLYIGGSGLARGYWRDPTKTAERFFEHPRTGERLYRTGDLGRYLPEGDVEFLGREDLQVKISGYRVELGEIEHALARVPGVEAGVAAALGDPRGDRRLVVYYVGHGGADVKPADVRRALAQRLPAYMVPAFVVPLALLPLTPNGKVDRRALPDPTKRPAVAGRRPDDDPGSLERRLRALWREVLEVADVRPDDSFFALGGTSVVAMRLVEQLQRHFDVRLPLARLYEAPTVRELAAAIAEARAASGFVAPEALPNIVTDEDARYDPFPLTDIQHAYWLGRRRSLTLGGVGTHSYTEIDVRDLDLERLEHALRRLIERHDMLRVVVDRDGRQRVLPRVPAYRVVHADLRGLPTSEREATLQRARRDLSHRVFATERWPLFDLRAHRLDDERTRLHVSVDLLAADAHSFQILVSELLELYAEPERVLSPLGCTFRDYVLALGALRATGRYRDAVAYWRSRLADLPPAPALPLARAAAELRAVRFAREQAELDRRTWAALQRRAARASLTPSVFLSAAFADVLGRWSGSRSFTVNFTTFERLQLHRDVDALVGDFTSTTLLAVDGLGPTFTGRAQRLQAAMWEALEHRLVSGVEVLRWLRRDPRRRLGASMPVVVTSTLVGHGTSSRRPAPAWDAETVYSITQTPQVLLDHQIYERDGRLLFNWDFAAAAFPPGLVQAMFAAYVRLLRTLASDESAWERRS